MSLSLLLFFSHASHNSNTGSTGGKDKIEAALIKDLQSRQQGVRSDSYKEANNILTILILWCTGGTTSRAGTLRKGQVDQLPPPSAASSTSRPMSPPPPHQQQPQQLPPHQTM